MPPSIQSHSHLCIAIRNTDYTGWVGQKKASSHSLVVTRGTGIRTARELRSDASVQWLNNRIHGQNLRSTPGLTETFAQFFFKIRPLLAVKLCSPQSNLYKSTFYLAVTPVFFPFFAASSVWHSLSCSLRSLFCCACCRKPFLQVFSIFCYLCSLSCSLALQPIPLIIKLSCSLSILRCS